MEDYPFLLKLAWLVRIILYIVVAPWLGWWVCDEVLRYMRDRRRSPDSPYRPGWPPGWVIDGCLERRYMAPEELARRIGCSASLIYDLIGGKAPLEKEMARDLAWALHLNATALLKMEAEYRLRLAKEAEADERGPTAPSGKRNGGHAKRPPREILERLLFPAWYMFCVGFGYLYFLYRDVGAWCRRNRVLLYGARREEAEDGEYP